MVSWTTYKGMTVPDSDSEDGGMHLTADIMALADGAPESSSSDPTPDDDSDHGYFIGSQWFNNTTNVMWACVDVTPTAARWQSLYKRIDNAIVLAPVAPPSGQGTDARSIQLDTGGDARGANATDLQRIRALDSQVASGANSAIVGGENNTASDTDSIVVGGKQNTASGAYSAVVAGRYNIAGGLGSHVEGYQSRAIGNFAHAEGYNAYAIGKASHCEGWYASGAADYCHAEGWNCAARAAYSHAEGKYTIASAPYCHSGGYLSHAHLPGQWARAAGGQASGSSGVGTAQTTITHLFARTTNATAAVLKLNGSVFGILPGQTLSCIVNVVGRKESGSVSDNASFIRQVLIYRGSSSPQIAGGMTPTIGSDLNPGSWGGVAITADTTNNALQIAVTGAASTNIRWTATVIASEVADAGF